MPNLDDCVPTAELRRREAARKAAERRKLPHAVYRMYSSDGTLLYIGCTYNVPVRLRGHIAWLPQVASITLEWHPNVDEALAAETQAIRDENPIYNVKDTPRAKPAEYVRQQHLVSADPDKAVMEQYNRPAESARCLRRPGGADVTPRSTAAMLPARLVKGQAQSRQRN